MTNATTTTMQTFPVLSIDAWGNEEDGYDWNSWNNVGTIDLDLNLDAENRDIIRYIICAMIGAGYLQPIAKEACEVEDDGYNVVIVLKTTREPLFAIEYGSTI